MIRMTILIPFPVSVSVCPSISVVLLSSLILFTCFFSWFTKNLVFLLDGRVRSIVIYQPSKKAIINTSSNNDEFASITCSPTSSAHEFVLPAEDSLAEVMCRLPPKDMIRCKSVSKSWNKLISDVCIPKVTCPLYGFFFPSGFTADRSPCSTSAWNFTCLTGTNNSSFFQSCFRMLPFTPIPEDFFDCSNGFLLIWGRLSERFYVVNPTTEQFIALPRSLEYTRPCSAALVFGPPFSVFYVLRNPLRIFIYSSATCEWTEHRDGLYLEDPILAANWGTHHVSLHGSVYRLSLSGHILKFDTKQVSARAILLPEVVQGTIRVDCIGVSKGHFHYAMNKMDQIRVWMLHESEWVLKHTISLLDFTKRPTWLVLYAFHPNSDNLFLGQGKWIFCYHPDNKKLECVNNTPISTDEVLAYPFSQNLATLTNLVKHQGCHGR